MAFVVSSSNKDTTLSAVETLKSGGNAYDAILCALFTSFVSEPLLSSPGGGGYLLAKPINQEPVIYDFFSQTPLTTSIKSKDFFPITGDFGSTTQDFHIGMAAAAVPGVLSGAHSVHKDLASMGLNDLAKNAILKARHGLTIDKNCEQVIKILHPILNHSSEAKSLYSKNNQWLKEGDVFKNQKLANFLTTFASQPENWFSNSSIVEKVTHDMTSIGGFLSKADFENYRTIKRKPTIWSYNDWSLYTNASPSRGGKHIVDQLNTALKKKVPGYQAVVSAMYELDQTIQTIDSLAESSKGTTHISVIDTHGNAASLTLSNGEGNGYIVPEGGFMLNNFLGEQDINTDGFFRWQPNSRMISMMSPTILTNQNSLYALGTGGSNRIKTAMFQVIYNLISKNNTLAQAVNAPRMHLENNNVDFEPGIPVQNIESILKTDYKLNPWEQRSLFFGGVNAVQYGSSYCAVGDSRRSGFSYIETDF